MRYLLALLLLVPLVACEKEGSTLSTVAAEMESLVGKVGLGDRAGITFAPLYGDDWFVLVPAHATAEMFADASLAEALQPIPPALLGAPEPLMAVVEDGKATTLELPWAYQVPKVMGKRGKNVHGIRFVRLIGAHRSYRIEAID